MLEVSAKAWCSKVSTTNVVSLPTILGNRQASNSWFEHLSYLSYLQCGPWLKTVLTKPLAFCRVELYLTGSQLNNTPDLVCHKYTQSTVVLERGAVGTSFLSSRLLLQEDIRPQVLCHGNFACKQRPATSRILVHIQQRQTWPSSLARPLGMQHHASSCHRSP